MAQILLCNRVNYLKAYVNGIDNIIVDKDVTTVQIKLYINDQIVLWEIWTGVSFTIWMTIFKPLTKTCGSIIILIEPAILISTKIYGFCKFET